MSVDHYENFPVASWLLPARLREPVAAVYWFARRADDAADEGDTPPAQRLAALAAMRAQLDCAGAGGTPDDAVIARLARAVAEHHLPLAACYDLLDAFAQDVVKTRYADYAELRDYCRRSADPVGRLMLALYRAATPDNIACSDAICTSLQLINHWQDVAVDWRKNAPAGRVYLPQDEMRRYGVDVAHLAEARCDTAWRALMAFQVGRARDLMHAGAPLARRLPGRIGLELRAVVAGGLRVLEKIEAVEYDVFRRRPTLVRADAPRLLWRALFA